MRSVLALVAACTLVASCGGESGDLMAIEVTGGFAKNRGPLEIVVTSDGRATCNEQRETTIPSDLLIDAREIERDLGDLADMGFSASEGKGARFVVRIKAGTVRWAEGGETLRDPLPQTQLLALKLDRLVCR